MIDIFARMRLRELIWVALVYLTVQLSIAEDVKISADLSNTHPVSKLLYGIFFEEVLLPSLKDSVCDQNR